MTKDEAYEFFHRYGNVGRRVEDLKVIQPTKSQMYEAYHQAVYINGQDPWDAIEAVSLIMGFPYKEINFGGAMYILSVSPCHSSDAFNELQFCELDSSGTNLFKLADWFYENKEWIDSLRPQYEVKK